ncbi:hypothetical protein Leryth_003890 [Lithospermum erythrorhizon]|nr:hypothetical protein Leryth_003890 [Lithospermum erythrorhizon]
MARTTPFHIFTLSIFLISAIITIISAIDDDHYAFVKAIDKKKLGLKKEKLSHFKLYWHDVVSGPSPTSIMVVKPPSNSSSGFGLINMIDNPLTMGPELSSEVVGRAQGIYASASQKDIGLLMVMNFAFTKGKYNGSTISILGRNSVFDKVREMTVIGGSGVLRFARGYAQATTNKFDLNTGDATVEYNVYVMHY